MWKMCQPAKSLEFVLFKTKKQSFIQHDHIFSCPIIPPIFWKSTTAFFTIFFFNKLKNVLWYSEVTWSSTVFVYKEKKRGVGVGSTQLKGLHGVNSTDKTIKAGKCSNDQHFQVCSKNLSWTSKNLISSYLPDLLCASVSVMCGVCVNNNNNNKEDF